MSEDIQHPGQNKITDDVEGHCIRGRALPTEDSDDVEGHGIKYKFALPQDEQATDEGDDTEGRGSKYKF